MGNSIAGLPRSISSEAEDERGVLRAFVEEYDKQGGDDPLKLYEALAKRLGGGESEEAAKNSKKGFLRVVVVDSCESSLEMARRALRVALGGETELETRTVADGASALAALRAAGARLNILLLEIDMATGMSGIELMQAINEDDDLARTTSASLLTNASDATRYDAFMSYGANEILSKPLTVHKAAQIMFSNGLPCTAPSLEQVEAWPFLRPANNNKQVVIGFTTSLATSVVSRNLVRMLAFYGGALRDAKIEVVVVNDDDVETLAKAVDEAGGASPILVSDETLEASACFVGMCPDGKNGAAPREGLVFVSDDDDDDDGKRVHRRLASLDSRDDANLFAELAATTTSAIAGKQAGLVSAMHAWGQNTIIPGLPLRCCCPGEERDALVEAFAGVRERARKGAYESLNLSPPHFAADDVVPKRVLVVEDSTASAAVVIRILLGLGHVAVHAADGVEAFRLFQQSFGDEFDCVLSDVNMPRMDGVELLSRIRAVDRCMPVVLITGLEATEEERTVLCDKFGAQRVLDKPPSIDGIREVVDACPSRRSPIAPPPPGGMDG
ncbi:hypothetical protein CTAYLR_000081 [Chrysophaeum taylorii]|uniref:Response regulatory domain-containing protein n=1 Tax=Chrysophaeum taylorii TaxID=2483200 RepID=A0AAD7UGJ6_9STRA|nr:hypothetical protein CTAYLR_000081 [Chrysophaeum taylorii]